MKHIKFTLIFLFILSISYGQTIETYQYDAQYRLEKVFKADGGTIAFQYDEAGNRLNYTVLNNIQGSVLFVTPSKDTIDANAGSITYFIQNKGKGNMKWQAVSNNDWLSFAGDTSGINNDSIVVNYSFNPGISRNGTIAITSAEASNSPQIVSIYQEGFTFSNHLWHIASTGSDVTGNGSVDKPFATIQKGIDTAVTGDTVLVHPGTYYENLNMTLKDLKIVSMWAFSGDSSDITNTIIDGNKKGRVFTLYKITFSTRFDGFTITDGLDTTKNGSGGAFNLTNSNPELTNLIIKNNVAQYGGAISCYQSNPSLYNVKILNNTATREGGGISCNQSNPVMKNCMINSNISFENGGGLTLYDSSNARIINSMITNNKAGSGGGGLSINKNCSPELTNVTIARNQAAQSPGIQSNNSTPIITNSIVWDMSYFNQATITYSDIQGGWTGKTNIDSYPEFQDTTSNNYNLKCVSPCVNTGNPDTTGLGIGSNDILGNSRIFDNIIDMGAFEYQGTAAPGQPDTIMGFTAVCQGSMDIVYNIQDIQGATSYIWTLPSGFTGASDSNSISVNFDSLATSGNIKVMGNNICGAGAERTLFVTVNDIPKTPAIALIDGVLNSNSVFGNQWYLDSLMIQNAIYDTLIPSKKGDYYVIVTLNTCSSYPSNIISFTPLNINVISASGKIKVYPNPTTGTVEVSVTGLLRNDYKVEIINNLGKVVQTILKNRIDNKFSLDLNNYPAGIYLIKLSDSQKSYFVKILKQ